MNEEQESALVDLVRVYGEDWTKIRSLSRRLRRMQWFHLAAAYYKLAKSLEEQANEGCDVWADHEEAEEELIALTKDFVCRTLLPKPTPKRAYSSGCLRPPTQMTLRVSDESAFAYISNE